MFFFYEVFKECRKLVLSGQFQPTVRESFYRPPLDSFRNVKEILAFLHNRSNHTCLGEVRRRNEIFKRLLEINQESDSGAELDPLFLLVFRPALLNMFRQYRGADHEGDEIGQVIFTCFLEVVNNYSLSNRPDMIATNIMLDTKHKVSLWVQEQNQRREMEGQEIEEVPEAKIPHNPAQEKTLIRLVDMLNGLGYDEDTDRICMTINQLYEQGIINDTEKKILLGRLVYQETLRDMVPGEEYEKWKKQIQRLTKKYFMS